MTDTSPPALSPAVPRTRAEVAALFPGVEEDLVAVSEWLECPIAELALDLAVEPMSLFAGLAQDLIATYPSFPKDAARTRKILKALQRGEPQHPVFVDARDGFLMEGRHRIAAFHMAGLASVPVVYARRVSLDPDRERAAAPDRGPAPAPGGR